MIRTFDETATLTVIDWATGEVEIVTETTEWEEIDTNGQPYKVVVGISHICRGKPVIRKPDGSFWICVPNSAATGPYHLVKEASGSSVA